MLIQLNMIEDKNLIAIHYKVIWHTYDKVIAIFCKTELRTIYFYEDTHHP